MSATLTSALWDLGRGSGVAALVAFTVSLVLGILTRSGATRSDWVASGSTRSTGPPR
jgi:hypothetical protein